MSVDALIVPEWPCAPRVKSIITTRHGGVSKGVYGGFNLADHVGDDPQAVIHNRELLKSRLDLDHEPRWLRQVHGVEVVDVSSDHPEADGSYSLSAGPACVVMTADCLPVLLADEAGTRVAALHAGWRGLAEGIIEQGVKHLGVPGDTLLAYLGPAIGPQAFEVGADVVEAFCRDDAAADQAFDPAGPGKWLADIYQLARLRLSALGVTRVYGGDRCTFTETEDFFSFRRDRDCGRMASLIWIEK